MMREDNGQFNVKYTLDGEYKDLSDDYGGWVSANRDKQTTIDRLKAGVRAWLHFCSEEGVHPYDAGENTVRIYIQDMQNSLEETTITRRVATVAKFYHWLDTDARKNMDIDNPVREISLPRDYNIKNRSGYVRVVHKDDRDDIIAPSYADFEPMFGAVPGEKRFTKARNRLICRLLWETAARSDEVSRWRLDNISEERREIEFRSAKLNREDHPKLYKRKVWWEPDTDQLYKWYLAKRSDIDPDEDSPYLFISEHGNQLEPSTISRVVKQAAHNAGINEPLVRGDDGSVQQWLYTAHRLRHARISHLANETDMDLNFLRMMAGHVKFDTTLSYVEANWDEARKGYEHAVQ